MTSQSIDYHNYIMNGWYWQRDVLRILSHALGFQNQRILDAVRRYKAEHRGDRYGKSLEHIVYMENDGIYPIVKGIENCFRGLEPGLRKLSDSGNLHDALSHSLAAFVVVKGHSIACANGGKDHKLIPVTDLRGGTQTLQNYYLNFQNPPPEILQSFVGKPRDCYGRAWPSRVLFVLDIEYHSTFKHQADDDRAVFDRIEPARKIIEHTLLHYGIPHSCIMTGRGYHFISQVMGSSPFMEHLVNSGWKIEGSVEAHANSDDLAHKVGFKLPVTCEKAYKTITRLQQYLFTKVTRRIRASQGFKVEVSDRGSECIVLDNTSQLRTAHTGNVAVCVSPYEKFYEEGGRIMVRLPRSHNAHEWVYMNDAHHRRRYFDASMKLISNNVGYIPEASEGLWNLLQEYWRSDLFLKLHNVMDHTESEHPNTWGHTYRAHDYHYLKQFGLDVWPLTHDRNPVMGLLNPDVLNHFIYSLDRHGWNPKHISGVLRSIYEDPRFNFGDTFFQMDAERHANGWVEIILGQKFEQNP